MRKMNSFQLCLLAFSAAFNVAGASLALAFRLPIYLDCIGTVAAAALLGPFGGMAAGGISSLISGFTSDIYGLYYMPVQLITGAVAGIFFQKVPMESLKGKLGKGALILCIPGTVVSSLITVGVFGGVTSSGSSLLAQLLHSQGVGLTESFMIVQILTDYVDRLVVLTAAAAIVKAVPISMRKNLRKVEKSNGTL